MNGANDYLNFIADEYLGDFILKGGAAVKFAVGQDDALTLSMERGLRSAAEDAGYVFASVNAATTKMSMIDRVFHAVAAQVPWDALAASLVKSALDELRFPVPPGEAPTLESIARFNRYDFQELRRDFHRRLQEKVFNDFQMAQEFRIAMVRLCQATISGAPDAREAAESILLWLRGELRHIAQLKPHLIYQRIARNNAMHMLYSLGPWIRKAGGSGLVLHLDIRQCAIASRSQTDGIFYTKPAVLDVYEILRQLIDATDELKSTLVVVTAGNEFLSDESRGLLRYWALRLRILDEVRDHSRVNPYSGLVRLDSFARPGQEVLA